MATNIQLINTLPRTLPTPPANASADLKAYHSTLSGWYSSFLLAYNTHQQQILSKISSLTPTKAK